MQNLIIVRVGAPGQSGGVGASVLLERHATMGEAGCGGGGRGVDVGAPTLAWDDGGIGVQVDIGLFQNNDYVTGRLGHVRDPSAGATSVATPSPLESSSTSTNSVRTGDGGGRDHESNENERWRDLAVRLSRPTWDDALKGEAQVISVEGRHMIYVGERDLLFLLAGSGTDFDELGLHEVLLVLMSALRQMLGVLESERLLKNFGKVCLVVDQIWEDGSLASMDVSHVLANAKLKKAVMEV